MFNCFLAVHCVACSLETHMQYLYVPSLAHSLSVSLSLYSVLPAEHYTQECSASERLVNLICFELGACKQGLNEAVCVGAPMHCQGTWLPF